MNKQKYKLINVFGNPHFPPAPSSLKVLNVNLLMSCQPDRELNWIMQRRQREDRRQDSSNSLPPLSDVRLAPVV